MTDPVIIADVKLNDKSTLKSAMKAVDTVKECGCFSVAFELFRGSEVLEKSCPLNYLEFWELQAYCNDTGMLFIPIPLSTTAVNLSRYLSPIMAISPEQSGKKHFLEYAFFFERPLLLELDGRLDEDEVKWIIRNSPGEVFLLSTSLSNLDDLAVSFKKKWVGYSGWMCAEAVDIHGAPVVKIPFEYKKQFTTLLQGVRDVN